MNRLVGTIAPMTKPRYPFRRLRGPFDMYRSGRASHAKLHLLRACEGLSRVPDEAVVAETFSDVEEVLRIRDIRPCRMCALSSLVITACLANTGGPNVRFSVTSQPSPVRVDGNPLSSEYRKATPSGALRLTRLAKRLGWSTTATALGPVAVGTANAMAVDFLARNLRTVALPEEGEVDLAAVELFWTLAADSPPEAGGDLEFPQLWAVASTLMTASAPALTA